MKSKAEWNYFSLWQYVFSSSFVNIKWRETVPVTYENILWIYRNKKSLVFQNRPQYMCKFSIDYDTILYYRKNSEIIF